MKFPLTIIALLCLLPSTAFAKITIFNFSGVIQFQDFNGDETPGLSLAPIQTGDIVRGNFAFDDSVVGQVIPPSGSRQGVAFFLNPVRQSQIQIFRNDALIYNIRLRPIIFANGNPSDLSQIVLLDGDTLRRRDTLSLSIEGGDPQTGPALDPAPAIPGLESLAFNLSFREQCATGSVELGTCISNSPDLDFFDGSNPRINFLKAFNDGGFRDLAFGLNFRNGDFSSAFGTFDSFSAIPEPQTWTSLIIGFGFIGFAGRRHRTKRAKLIS